MPILAEETSLYPSDLLSESEFDSTEIESEGKQGLKWWLLHTRPRQEKSLARDLIRRNLAFYLPLVRRRILVRAKPVYSTVPLFDSYVFLRGSDEDRVRALITGRVSKVIPCPDGLGLRSDLQRIWRLIEAGVPLTMESRLRPNQRVCIHAGPLKGLVGTVLKRKNKTRILVWVTMLHQGISVEIDDCFLEPEV